MVSSFSLSLGSPLSPVFRGFTANSRFTARAYGRFSGPQVVHASNFLKFPVCAHVGALMPHGFPVTTKDFFIDLGTVSSSSLFSDSFINLSLILPATTPLVF